MEPRDDARIATLWSGYVSADFKWECDGDWHDLRVGAPAPEIDAMFPDAYRYGLISAWNPGLEARPDVVNRQADRALQAALDAMGTEYRPGFAAAQNRSWRAPNWIVVDPVVEDFDALASRFGQLGTLLWPRGEHVRLRMYASRPEGVPEHPWTDWVK